MPGSLRYEVFAAASGDTIDLSQLMCSTITLDGAWPNPEIEVAQDTLYFKGPADGHLTIDGGEHSNVFQHFGSGTLGITDLTIANGKYVSSASPLGGCIYSSGNVHLTRAVVSHCTVVGTGFTDASGGGVYAAGDLFLTSSALIDNHVVGTNDGEASGGGAFVYGNFNASYATISSNTAYANAAYSSRGFGGGVTTRQDVTIQGSTLSKNHADFGGALALGWGFGVAKITNSTISTNSATYWGGVWTGIPLTLTSSTISFNKSSHDPYLRGAGLYALGADLNLQSSIIAGNVGAGSPSDLGDPSLTATISGQNNLVVAFADDLIVPADTLRDCPQLQPLADNGGSTFTHALSQTSPAIDHGNNPVGLVTDQRFATRVVNAVADIGSVEWQPSDTDERVFASGFDGLCDQ